MMNPLFPLGAAILPEQKQALESLVKSEVFFPIALAVVGALLLLFGFKAYKAIVVFNCIALGFWIGGLLGARVQVPTVAAIVGAALLGAVAWPLMKYAVAVCGGLVGAVVGMVVWCYFDYPPNMAWAGGLAGLIFLGLLSFLLFKMSVIVFSCIQGAAMVVLGIAAVLTRVPSWKSEVLNGMTSKPVLMPLLVFSVALLGIIWQQQRCGLLGGEGAKAPAGGAKAPDKK